MSLLGQMKDMYKLQKQAKQIKKELAKIHVFAESNGIKVTVSAEMEVMKVEIVNETILQDANKLGKAILEATNKALKKAQQISAEKMKDMMGGIPGMPGM